MEAENCLVACLWKALANMAMCGVSVSVRGIYKSCIHFPANPSHSLVNTVDEEMLSKVSVSLHCCCCHRLPPGGGGSATRETLQAQSGACGGGAAGKTLQWCE